jgi:hypothetical protein
VTVLTSTAQLGGASPGGVAILFHTEHAPAGFALIDRQGPFDVYQRQAY